MQVRTANNSMVMTAWGDASEASSVLLMLRGVAVLSFEASFACIFLIWGLSNDLCISLARWEACMMVYSPIWNPPQPPEIS